MRAFISLFLASILFVCASNSAFANVAPTPTPECTPIYNGGQTCFTSKKVTVNKKVLRPQIAANPNTELADKDFVENVNQKDTPYAPQTPTAYRIYVTNETASEIKNIVISDVFPANFLTFTTAAGTFDSKTRTFSTTLASLKPKETKKITIHVLTASNEELASRNIPTCTVNVAFATFNKETVQDNAMVCVKKEGVATTNNKATESKEAPKPTNPFMTKGGLPVASPVAKNSMEKAPSTGPEALALIGLIPAGIAGFMLRRKV